jgi:hypothetical protein
VVIFDDDPRCQWQSRDLCLIHSHDPGVDPADSRLSAPSCNNLNVCYKSNSEVRSKVHRSSMPTQIRIQLSFAMQFRTGGYSLSPTFAYYPTINAAKAPPFQIIPILEQAELRTTRHLQELLL